MTKLVIIADDLTGALDAAAPFADIPGGVRVATRPEALASALEGRPGVVAVSTRSREMQPDAARTTVASVLRRLPPGVRLFKKVDSRLKGPVAAELAALSAPLLVAPAIPDMGRIVLGGAVRGFGLDTPIPIAPLLGSAAARATIPDTETGDDLTGAIAEADTGTLLVGARGLAVALARTMGLGGKRIGAVPAPLVIAVGSTDPITLAQVARLQRLPELVTIDAPGGRAAPTAPGRVTLLQLTGPRADAAETARRFAAAVAAAARNAATLALTGGATAEAGLDALGLDCLDLLGEAAPGIPVSAAAGRTVVTKSGGFGAPSALADLAAMAREGAMP